MASRSRTLVAASFLRSPPYVRPPLQIKLRDDARQNLSSLPPAVRRKVRARLREIAAGQSPRALPVGKEEVQDDAAAEIDELEIVYRSRRHVMTLTIRRDWIAWSLFVFGIGRNPGFHTRNDAPCL